MLHVELLIALRYVGKEQCLGIHSKLSGSWVTIHKHHSFSKYTLLLFVIIVVLMSNFCMVLNVKANPDASLIQPSAFNDVNARWDNEANVWDWNNATSATETQSRIGAIQYKPGDNLEAHRN